MYRWSRIHSSVLGWMVGRGSILSRSIVLMSGLGLADACGPVVRECEDMGRGGPAIDLRRWCRGGRSIWSRDEEARRRGRRSVQDRCRDWRRGKRPGREWPGDTRMIRRISDHGSTSTYQHEQRILSIVTGKIFRGMQLMSSQGTCLLSRHQRWPVRPTASRAFVLSCNTRARHQYPGHRRAILDPGMSP